MVEFVFGVLAALVAVGGGIVYASLRFADDEQDALLGMEEPDAPVSEPTRISRAS